MRTFIKYFFVLLCLVFILDRTGGYFLNKLYAENKVGSTGGKINYYLSMPPPDLLIMGSSRALFVNPDSFKVSCYNLGHEGMDDVFQAGLLHILIKYKKTPKTILLHIDPMVYYRIDSDKYSTGIENLRYFYGKDSLVTEYINDISFHERFFFWLDTYRYNGRAFELMGDVIKTRYHFKPTNGYVALPPTIEDSQKTVTTAKEIEKLGPFKISRLRYILEFIQLCKQNHIKLILFTSPLFRNQLKNTNELDSIFNSKNIPYINYGTIELPALEDNPKLWENATHLNFPGIQIFSGDLAKRVAKAME